MLAGFSESCMHEHKWVVYYCLIWSYGFTDFTNYSVLWLNIRSSGPARGKGWGVNKTFLASSYIVPLLLLNIFKFWGFQISISRNIKRNPFQFDKN